MPTLLRAALSRTVALFTRGRAARDFDRELDAHLALLAERFAAQGMTPEEAARAARRQFGGVTQVKQERYESRGFAWIETLLQDVRHALRALARTPGFTVTALAALALGIGANTAIFSMVNAILLRPLKAPEANRIVRFVEMYGSTSSEFFGAPAYIRWRGLTDTFEEVAAHRLEMMNLTGGGQPRQIPVARITSSFFRLFGAPVMRGRIFTSEEDRPGAVRVAVLSYGLWKRRFAGDPGAVGKVIILGSAPYVVVGVLAPGFDTEQFDPIPEAWIPLQVDPDAPRKGDLLIVTGRLKDGVALQAARARLQAAAAAEDAAEGQPAHSNDGGTPDIELLRDALEGDVRPLLLLLSGTVGFVLLIACGNVAGLLLVRASRRKREFAIRASLGAGRLRILRQLLTESVVLSLAGGALGLLLGVTTIRAMLSRYAGSSLDAAGYPVHLARIGASASAVTVDWRVAAFTVLVSVLAGVLFGLLPAIGASRRDLGVELKESFGRSGTGLRENKKRSAFVVGEMALALVLLIGAALLTRSYVALRSVNPGFDERHVLVAQTALGDTPFTKISALDRLVRQGTGRIRALPGVVDAGAACCIPLETTWQMPLIVEGRPLKGWFHAFAGWTFVSPGYFNVLRVPLLRGRTFTERDGAGAPPVAIINQALARGVWPHGDPLQDSIVIGRGMGPAYGHDPVRRIIGIVGDIRDRGLNNPARPAMYVPIAQLPDSVAAADLGMLPMAWFIRAPSRSWALGVAIGNELEEASGGLPVGPIRSMDQVASQSAARQRLEMLLMTIFSGVALLLAAIGIYGLMAYTVQQRTHELGIRMALGASAGCVRKLVVMQGLRLALTGVAIGLAAAFGLMRLLAGFLYGVKPRDPLVFAFVPLILMGVALAAVWLPAVRATRVDPVRALRCDF
jgi:putative ABC transport system permease protein